MWRSGKHLTSEDYIHHIEELNDKGFGGIMMFCGHPRNLATDPIFQKILEKAEQKSMLVGSNNCGSWPAGGPWMSKDNLAWTTISSSLDIDEGMSFSGKLSKPSLPRDGRPEALNGVVTIAVQAFRLPDHSVPEIPKVTVSSNAETMAGMFDYNWNTAWIPDEPDKNDKANQNAWVLFDYVQPREIDAFWFESKRLTSQLQASDDGVNFRTFYTPPNNGHTCYSEFPAQKARFFRVIITGLGDNIIYRRLSELAIGTRKEVLRRALLTAKIGLGGMMPPASKGLPQDQYRGGKYSQSHTGMRNDPEFAHEPLYALPSDQVLNPKTLIDLTDKVSPDGTLQWTPPPGRWRIIWLQRVIAQTEFPNPLLSAATHEDVEKNMGKLIEAAGTRAGKVFVSFHEDNNEIRSMYNWTPAMIEEFQKRRSYDPRPYLATLAGQIVGSVETTDRFLSDFRRTIADCVMENHYGLWTQLLHAQGIQSRSEAAGSYYPYTPSHDGIANLARVDIPTCEFWPETCEKRNWTKRNGKLIDPYADPVDWLETSQNVNVKMAASVSHLYGKKLVDAESFTSTGYFWSMAPPDLLLHANVAFCEGVNRMTFHASDTTSAAEGSPGSVYVGTHFNDKNTWWPYIKPFVQYIHRCSSMLQRGRFVADVLYCVGDEVPVIGRPKYIRDGRGFGYDYDDCNSEGLLSQISVKDGRLVTPEGMSYRVLVLPERATMTIAVAKKIRELVNAGASVIGPKPLRTPGLTGYPQCDTELKQIADELWNKGKVITNKTEKQVLEAMNVPVDFGFSGAQPDTLLDFIHRQDGDAEIYFVANRRNRTERLDATFRVAGKQPELWNAVTGKMEDARAYRMADGRTTVSLELPAYGSMFVVFQKPTTNKSKDGVAFVDLKPVQEITGPWQVQFDPKWGGPKEPVTFETLTDWTNSAEEGIKYYSGTATYKKAFSWQLAVGRKQTFLDLGVANQLARVRLNGKDLGVVWCAPWRVDVTNALKPGKNDLEINIVNTWYNRMHLDLPRPPEKRLMDFGYDGTGAKRWGLPNGGKGPLQPSGLLGPVRVLAAEQAER